MRGAIRLMREAISVEDGGVGFEYLMREAIRRDEGHT
jgi:hypothetical protein